MRHRVQQHIGDTVLDGVDDIDRVQCPDRLEHRFGDRDEVLQNRSGPHREADTDERLRQRHREGEPTLERRGDQFLADRKRALERILQRHGDAGDEVEDGPEATGDQAVDRAVDVTRAQDGAGGLQGRGQSLHQLGERGTATVDGRQQLRDRVSLVGEDLTQDGERIGELGLQRFADQITRGVDDRREDRDRVLDGCRQVDRRQVQIGARGDRSHRDHAGSDQRNAGRHIRLHGQLHGHVLFAIPSGGSPGPEITYSLVSCRQGTHTKWQSLSHFP